MFTYDASTKNDDQCDMCSRKYLYWPTDEILCVMNPKLNVWGALLQETWLETRCAAANAAHSILEMSPMLKVKQGLCHDTIQRLS